MKHYMKPTVEIYTLAGNETICGGCTNKLNENTTLNGLIAISFPETDSDGDLTLSKSEAARLFGPGESCKNTIDSYCKFTSTGWGNLSWS